MWKIREIQDKVTNVVMNYTVVESKVREATNDDQWGPHGTVMAELAKYTFTYEHFPEVMVLNGSERVITSARDHLHDMRQLENYQHTDEFGKDQGLNVRHKVKEILEVIQDDARLRDERKRAKSTKDKYVGMASEVIEDSFYSKYGDQYSDRYSREPRTNNKEGFGYNSGNAGAANLDIKSKFQNFKDTVTNMRPGKRDYSDYNTNNGRYDTYRDEPEEGEHVEEGEEFHDDSDIEDNFKYKSSKEEEVSEEAEKKKKSPVRKIDLGAAANLSAFSSPSPNASDGVKEEPAPVVADFADFETPKATSAIDDLSDVLTAPINQPSLLPISNDNKNDLNDDLFGDFSGSATTTSSQPAAGDTQDFANFESLESLNKPVSNLSLFDDFDSLSINSPQLQSDNSVNLMQPQPVMQPTNMMQPTATNNMMQANMMQVNPMQQMNMMQSSTVVSSNAAQPNVMMYPQGKNMYQPAPNTMMMSSNIARFPNNTNVNTTPVPANKSTMWSGTGVDISLDSLTPGGLNRKNPLPSMNQLSGQQFPSQNMAQPQQGFYNMPQQQQQQAMPGTMMMNSNMSGMNVGMTNMTRMPLQQQPMGTMQPNMGMQMNMGQPMMNQTQMGMHMNAQSLR